MKPSLLIHVAAWAFILSTVRAAEPAEDAPAAMTGIYREGGALRALSPEGMANPLLGGAVLEAEWADLEAEPGVYEWTYFERSLALLTIARRNAVLIVGGAPPTWLSEGNDSSTADARDRLEGKWREFVAAFGGRFASASGVGMAAVSDVGRRAGVWESGLVGPAGLGGEESIAANCEAQARRLGQSTALFATAFPDLPLCLLLELPEGEAGERWIAAAIDAGADQAPSGLVMIASGILGDKTRLDAVRPACRAIRAARGRVDIGVRLGRHIQESPAEPPAGLEAESPADRFRRAIGFGLWLGASHFQIDSAETDSLAARPDLLLLHSRLATLYGLPKPLIRAR
jgi:hypothetical protein